MDINIPYDLTDGMALDFCKHLDSVDEDNNYNFQLHLGTVEPFGMLLTAAKLRQFIKKRGGEGITFKGELFSASDYAAHMGFYQSFGLDFGNQPGRVNGNSSYIPITSIDVPNIRQEAEKNREHPGKTVTDKSAQLARVLSRGDDEIIECLTFSMRELMRNVVEHSRSDKLWIAAQYWPSHHRGNIVEVAILDEGVGLRKTLSENPGISVSNDMDALLLAIEPGITGNHFAYGDECDWANSGYGLFMTSSICKLAGDFIICSGNNAIKIDSKGFANFNTSFVGTAIRMRIKVPRIAKISRDEIVNEGQRRAAMNGVLPRKSASLVSRVLNP